jgi:hypothetical protein
VLVVGRAHPRPANRHAPPAQRHRPVLMTVALRCPVTVVLALRAYDLGHLELHQLVHDPEPNADTQREQALDELRPPAHRAPLGSAVGADSRRPPQPRRPSGRIPCSWRFLLSSRTWLAPVTLAARADEAGGPPFKVLRASGQPPRGRRARSVGRG